MSDPTPAELQKQIEDLQARVAAEEAHTHPVSRGIWPFLKRSASSLPTVSFSTAIKASWVTWQTLGLAVALGLFSIALPNFQGCTPGPVPPTPVDPLVASFQAAYAKDTEADRAKSLAFLQAKYPEMANATFVPGTNGSTFAWMKSRVEAPGGQLAATQVVNLRKAIAAELIGTFGSDASALVDPTKFKAELSKIGATLSGVK